MLAGEHNLTRSLESRKMMSTLQMQPQKIVVAHCKKRNALLFRRPSNGWTSVRNVIFKHINWAWKKKKFHCILKETKTKKGLLGAKIKARDVREALSKGGSRLERKRSVVQPVSTLSSSIRKKNLTQSERTSHRTSAKRPHSWRRDANVS